jgi:hypothetical protein
MSLLLYGVVEAGAARADLVRGCCAGATGTYFRGCDVSGERSS